MVCLKKGSFGQLPIKTPPKKGSFGQHTQAVTNAPLKLYEVYVGLYVHNNTQEAFAFDNDCCTEYIRRLNKELCVFLLDYFKGEN